MKLYDFEIDEVLDFLKKESKDPNEELLKKYWNENKEDSDIIPNFDW